MISMIAIAGFAFAGLCGAYRLLRGPEMADRIMAMDVTLVSLMGAITVDAARRDDPTNLIMLVVLAIVGFTATVAATRFLERDRHNIGDARDDRPDGSVEVSGADVDTGEASA